MKPIPALQAKNVSKWYRLANGENIEILKNINFLIEKNEFISIIGPSGCGKTTLIKLLAGLIEPTQGQILENSYKIKESTKNRGVCFQHYNLFPWLTVEKNIGFGLLIQKTPLEKIKQIISHYIEVMGLRGFEKAYPEELSFGMQQRVSLARTLAIKPKILLMDEPFAALDIQTKRFMQDLLLQILCQESRTVIFVTHDVEEAVFLSDTVYIMTNRPSTIREKIKINLERPRDLNTEFSKKFIDLKKYVQKIITKESLNLVKLNLEIYKNIDDNSK